MEEIRERVFDLFGGIFEVDTGQLLDEFGDVVGGAGKSSMG